MTAAATSNALYITALTVSPSAINGYLQVAIGVGGAGAEVSLGEIKIHGGGSNATPAWCAPIVLAFPIPVPAGARIACRSATEIGTVNALVTLECVNQVDLPGVI